MCVYMWMVRAVKGLLLLPCSLTLKATGMGKGVTKTQKYNI